MNTDRRAILALIAIGRITPAEAERLLAAWNESRETAWILVAGLGFALLAQLNMHDLGLIVRHLFSTQFPAITNMLGLLTVGIGGQL